MSSTFKPRKISVMFTRTQGNKPLDVVLTSHMLRALGLFLVRFITVVSAQSSSRVGKKYRLHFVICSPVPDAEWFAYHGKPGALHMSTGPFRHWPLWP